MKGKGGGIQLPELEFENVTDCYTMYVGIFEISEDVFWYSDIGFVKTIAANKTAYQKWINRQVELRNDGRKKRS